jgi:hypothetical protein
MARQILVGIISFGLTTVMILTTTATQGSGILA